MQTDIGRGFCIVNASVLGYMLWTSMRFEICQFYSKTRGARKIIVVDLGFLGDSVHLIPALWELRRHYPEAELETLSAPVGRELLALAPCVNQAHAFPLAPESPPWWRHLDRIGDLRRRRFDLAFNFTGSDRSIFMTALTGAPWRLAHEAGRRHFWNRWLIPHWVAHQDRGLPVYEQRRQVLAACGLTLSAPCWELRLPAEARLRAAALASEGAIHFSINASNAMKEWPLENWIALARAVFREYPAARILATGSGSAREQERLHSLEDALNDPRLLVLSGERAICDLAALLQRCRLHVGADSGVLHLAAALGMPTVAIFRDYPAKSEWLPRGPAHRHVLASCECVDSRYQPCAREGIARCLAAISPETVLENLRAALGRPCATG